MRILLFFIVSAPLLNFSHPLSNDEGIVLDHALKIANGQILYKDFESFVAPGSFYLTGFLFHIFTPSYWTAKVISLIFQLTSVFLIFKITFLLAKEKFLSQISAFSWLFISSISYPAISYNNQSTYLAIGACYFLLKARTSRKILLYYFLSGLFCGLVIIFLQNKGLFLTSFFTIFLFFLLLTKKLPPKSLVAFLSGSVLFPLSLFLVWHPNFLFQTLVIWPLGHQLSYNPHSPLVFLFSLTFLLMTIYVLDREKNNNGYILPLIAIAQVALLVSIDRRQDIYHLGINSFPFIIIFSYTVYKLSLKLKLQVIIQKIKFVFPILAVYLMLAILQKNLQSFITYEEFKAKVQKNNIKNFYAHPFLPGLYFELKMPNPYPNGFLFTGMHPQEKFNQNLAVLLAENPNHIFLNYETVKKFKYDTDNSLDKYINNHYKTIDNFGPVLILEKAN